MLYPSLPPNFNKKNMDWLNDVRKIHDNFSFSSVPPKVDIALQKESSQIASTTH
jgi:hypothetical protein